jgi:sigma-B regulation protein RsbU (phosphoserine phosphatase)
MNQEIDLQQTSILIVDDNVKNLQVLGGFLKIEGLSVEFALDGNSALRWLDKKKFDLILLDIMMPGMDGYEVCSVIKKNPLISEIPVIFITAKTDSESIVKGFESGAVDYITKPFIQSELIVRVKTQLCVSKSKEKILYYLHEIEERNTNINASIEYAKYIQTAVLNTSEKYFQYLPEHFFLYLPKDILSGDFYWVCKTGDKVIIAVLDCTGHGVPGALLSILGITLLNETVVHEHILQPDKILESLRTKIIRALGQKDGELKIKDGIEGIVICYEPGSKKLQYSGSFNPLILIHAGELTTIKADSFSIGFSDEIKSFTLHEIYVEENDTIYMFSDGIIDQFGGPVNRRFMIKHLKEIFVKNYAADMKLQKEILLHEINSWRGELVQTDDIMVMGIKF